MAVRYFDVDLADSNQNVPVALSALLVKSSEEVADPHARDRAGCLIVPVVPGVEMVDCVRLHDGAAVERRNNVVVIAVEVRIALAQGAPDFDTKVNAVRRMRVDARGLLDNRFVAQPRDGPVNPVFGL